MPWKQYALTSKIVPLYLGSSFHKNMDWAWGGPLQQQDFCQQSTCGIIMSFKAHLSR
jgi:hypothetical protein